MELKELTDKTLALFGISDPEQLGTTLLAHINDIEKLQCFCDLVKGDLTTDYLQKIYQYYLADRKEKKQDYTPKCLGLFMGLLAGDSEEITDLCAGSGALIIQKWLQNPNTSFKAIELDENVIPFLIFNMVIRNIECHIYKMNAIEDDQAEQEWHIQKGEQFGKVINIKSAL